jgi:hypothetical protein
LSPIAISSLYPELEFSGDVVVTQPTIGSNVEEITYKNIRWVSILLLGGVIIVYTHSRALLKQSEISHSIDVIPIPYRIHSGVTALHETRLIDDTHIFFVHALCLNVPFDFDSR